MKYVLGLPVLFWWVASQAQLGVVTGRVVEAPTPENPVANVGAPAVAVTVDSLRKGVYTDETGHFRLSLPPGTHRLKILGTAYQPLERVVVVEANATVHLGTLEALPLRYGVEINGLAAELQTRPMPQATTRYSASYFEKNPVPSLLEAAEGLHGVRPQLNCSICNTGDIHINGQEGAYTLLTIDGMPLVGGLSTVYGLFGIPVSLLQSLDLTKGPATVQYGASAMAGSIDVRTKSPGTAPRFSAEALATTDGHFQTDLGLSLGKGRVQNLLGVHYFDSPFAWDANSDGYTDFPLARRVAVFNKLHLGKPSGGGVQADVALRAFGEDRWGGQLDFTRALRGTDSLYGEVINTRRLEGWAQLRLPGGLQVLASYSWHAQHSDYGTTPYNAHQRLAFAQAAWQRDFSPQWALKLGGVFTHEFYDDNTPATAGTDTVRFVNQPERAPLPGLFAQLDWRPDSAARHWLRAGLRYDHDRVHGAILSPRVHYKWQLNDRHSLRLGAGTGYRVVRLFTEDHAALTGARTVVIEENLQPERSFTLHVQHNGIRLVQRGFLSLATEAFALHYSNQILPDYATDPNEIRYRNLDGTAFTAGLGVRLDLHFEFPLSGTVGVTGLLHRVRDANQRRATPVLREPFRANWQLSYAFPGIGLRIDYTGTLTAPMNLPTQGPTDPRPPQSPWFSVQNLQLVKRFARVKGLEVFAGVQNLLNFRPAANSIVRGHDPFDRQVNDPVDNPLGLSFDTDYVYASFRGARGVGGLRYRLQ